MINTKKQGNLIVISGPSGTGKDTVVNKLVSDKKDIWVSVSCTTRSPRGNEKDGVEYFFLKKEDFEKKINNNEFLEYAMFNDNYYGTLKSKIDEKLDAGIDVILVIEVQGALQINNLVKEAIFIFIMPPSMRELKNRLEGRKTESKDKVLERFKTAYKEINEISTYNYVVVNDDVDLAVKKVDSILTAEKCRVDRIIDIDLGNKEELLHEDLIDFNE